MLRISPRLKSAILLVGLLCVAAGGIWLLKTATPYGPGLRNDSVQYIFGARNLLAGNGYMRTSGGGELKPITTVPPLLSTVIAAFSLTGLEAMRSARLLLLLLFGLDIILLGVLVYRLTRSPGFALAGAALLACSGIFISNFAWLMSEPLFVCLWLLALLLYDLYQHTRRRYLLVVLGALVGLAYLTRYIGITLLAALALALLLFEPGWKQKFIALACLVLPFIPFAAGWAMRNTLLVGNPANRALLVHIVTPEKIHYGMDNLWDWLLPDSMANFYSSHAAFFHAAMQVLIGLALVGLVVVLIRFMKKPPAAGNKNSRYTLILLGLYFFIYLGMTLFSMSFIDASTVLDSRLMIPVYISLLILLMAGLAGLYARRELWWKISSLVIVLACAGFTVHDGWVETTKLSSLRGLGFDSISMKESPTIQYIQQMPPIIIYTNKAYMVYIVTGRLAYMLSGPIDPVTMSARANQEELEAMRSAVRSETAVLVYFKDKGYASDPWFLELTRGLVPIEEYSDGVIFKGGY